MQKPKTKMGLKERFKRLENGYTFDRYIFNAAMIIIFIYLFLVLYSYDFNFSKQIYYNCPADNNHYCENPFYIGANGSYNTDSPLPMKYKQLCTWDWCKEQYLEPGFEFGKKPTRLFNWASPFAIFILSLAFVINHFKHNRGFEFEKDNDNST